MIKTKKIRAAVIIIGNEILSGRTQDLNLQYIAEQLSQRGIYLEESRIIPDIRSRIIEVVRALSEQYDYVFTTGGIGPTHDDITTEAIAAAFGQKLLLNDEAKKTLTAYYKATELNEARLKMAYLPEGATLIANPVSAAPGFVLENVYVMAGIPSIMKVMFANILPMIKHGDQILSQSLTFETAESHIASILSQAQTKYPTIDIGSYPRLQNQQPIVTIVFRGTDKKKIKAALIETKTAIERLNLTAKSAGS